MFIMSLAKPVLPAMSHATRVSTMPVVPAGNASHRAQAIRSPRASFARCIARLMHSAAHVHLLVFFNLLSILAPGAPRPVRMPNSLA